MRESEPRSRRSRATLGAIALITVVAVSALAALGAWQLQRRAWKRDLVTRVEARVHAPPIAAPPPEDWPRVSAESDGYRRVAVTGRFLNDRETLTQAVTERGGGYWVMTPLRATSGAIVLVNRGFVPAGRRDPASREQGRISAQTTIVGLLRVSEPGGGFLRANDPLSDRWHSRDTAAIGAARGLGPVAPYFIDADATPNAGGLPAGGLTVVAFSDNHLVYAATWLTLALMAGGAGGYLIRERMRPASSGDGGSADPPDQAR